MSTPSPIPPRSASESALSLVAPRRQSPILSASTSQTTRSDSSANFLKSLRIDLDKKKNMSFWSKYSDLTEENLKDHNRRIEALSLDSNRKKSSSPYYQGLTDSTLVISRQIQGQRLAETESHAPSDNTSVTWTSSLKTKVQEWSFCLPLKRNKDDAVLDDSLVYGPRKPSSSLKKPTKKDVIGHDHIHRLSENKESDSFIAQLKPLRERVLEKQQQLISVQRPLLVIENDANEKEFDMGQTVWADKYRPIDLGDFLCNKKKAMLLQSLVRPEDCGHFIFQGPAGVGKRTMVWAFLRAVYGADRTKTKLVWKEFDLKGESVGTIQVQVRQSSQHIEVNLSDLKGYEKHVIVQLIKERHIKSSKAIQYENHNCRAIILYEADKLSADALLYIRWLLERHKGFNKVFFCCSDLTKLQPIKTLCNIIQLFPPTEEEIVQVLELIAKQEGLELPDELAKKFAENSNSNLRQAIRSFEATWRNNYPFTEDQGILTGWEDVIANIAKNIIEEQSPKQLYDIRRKLQTLVEHNVPCNFIFKTLFDELKKHLDEDLKPKIVSLYNEYSNVEGNVLGNDKSRTTSKEEETSKSQETARRNAQLFVRIEEFIAKLMSLYKASLTTAKANQTVAEVEAS